MIPKVEGRASQPARYRRSPTRRGRAFVLLASVLLLASAATAAPSDDPAAGGAAGGPPADQRRVADARGAAGEVLAHVYAVYLGIRGCAEASRELGRAEFLPTIGLDEVREAMRAVDAAAREAKFDVDAIWARISPLGLATAEAVKKGTPDNERTCKALGSVFRADLSTLQNVFNFLGVSRSIILKDF